MNVGILDETAGSALRMLAMQVAVTLLLALAGTMIWDARIGISLLAGGGIGLAGSTYGVIQLLRHGAGSGARSGVAGIFIAWAVKVVLVLALMILAFRSRIFTPPALLAGLAAGLLSNWVWWVNRTSKQDGN